MEAIDDQEDIQRQIKVHNDPAADSDDGSSWEDFDDSESLLNDVVNAEEDPTRDSHAIHSAQDICTPQEGQALKRSLIDHGPENFVRENLTSGKYTARKLLTAFGVKIPEALEGRADSGYFRLLGIAISRVLVSRVRLSQYNNIEDAVKLLKEKKHVMVITGAGISTNLGVPDFRSKDTGFYAQMREKGFADPEEIFNIEVFDEDPSIFYDNSGKTLPAPGKTTPTHAFIKMLQDRDQLLTNYTQNIDNVEGTAGISTDRLIQCHGSWATFKCRKCAFEAPGEQFHEAVRNGKIPRCSRCLELMSSNNPHFQALKRKRSSNSDAKSRGRKGFDIYDDENDDDEQYSIPEAGIMKPNITFFGEKLSNEFFDRFKNHDRHSVDLVIVIGTSLTVAPVSEIPLALDPHIPHIYISRDRVRHMDMDITLLGDCDIVVAELSKRLDWNLKHHMLPAKVDNVVTEVESGIGVWTVKPRLSAEAVPTNGAS